MNLLPELNDEGKMSAAEVDQYIAGCAEDVQPLLESIREAIKEVAPEAEEIISYRMPAFRQGKMIAYYAAFKQHIGFYPPVPNDEKLLKAAAKYAGPKGNLQFPLDQPMPLKLIQRIVKYRLKELAKKS